MADSDTWTDPLHTPRTRDIHRDYEQWATVHRQLQGSAVPKEGRDYVAHAITLISLLEGFAELHPIAKSEPSSL